MQVTCCQPFQVYIEESAAITVASRQLCKRYPDRRGEADFVHFSLICCKTRHSLCPWGRDSRQGEAHCMFMGHLLPMQTNRSQDNTSFVILPKSASHSEQKCTTFSLYSSMLKSTKSPEQSWRRNIHLEKYQKVQWIHLLHSLIRKPGVLNTRIHEMAVCKNLKWHRPFAHIKNKQQFLLSKEGVKRKLKAEVT